jgi:hypothetical protein
MNYKAKLELTRRNQEAMMLRVHDNVKEARAAELVSYDLGHLGDVCDNVALHVAKICGGEDVLRTAPEAESSTTSRMTRVRDQIYNVLRAVSLLANSTIEMKKDLDAVNQILGASISDLGLEEESAHFSRTYSSHITSLEQLDEEPILSPSAGSSQHSSAVASTGGVMVKTTKARPANMK